MQKILLFLSLMILSVLSFAGSSQLQSSVVWKHYQETMRLVPGSSMNCQNAFGHLTIKGDFSYYLIPAKLKGEGYVSIQNISGGYPPITAVLYQQGDSDRYGFGHYYLPAMTLMNQHRGPVGLRGIIFNVCMDSEASTQAAVMLMLPRTNEVCLLATPVWNYCR